jgi:hypothetical protein
MQPYRVDGSYDRPIPRRILEEQGIPRGTFAQEKKAVNLTLTYTSFWWSKHSLKDLRAFERRVVHGPKLTVHYHLRGLLLTVMLVGYYGALKLARVVKLEGLLKRLVERLVGDFTIATYNHPRYSNMAFLWALEKIRQRYPTEGGLLAGQSHDDSP